MMPLVEIGMWAFNVKNMKIGSKNAKFAVTTVVLTLNCEIPSY